MLPILCCPRGLAESQECHHDLSFTGCHCDCSVSLWIIIFRWQPLPLQRIIRYSHSHSYKGVSKVSLLAVAFWEHSGSDFRSPCGRVIEKRWMWMQDHLCKSGGTEEQITQGCSSQDTILTLIKISLILCIFSSEEITHKPYKKGLLKWNTETFFLLIVRFIKLERMLAETPFWVGRKMMKAFLFSIRMTGLTKSTFFPKFCSKTKLPWSLFVITYRLQHSYTIQLGSYKWISIQEVSESQCSFLCYHDAQHALYSSVSTNQKIPACLKKLFYGFRLCLWEDSEIT